MTLKVYVSGGCWVCDGVAEVLQTVMTGLPDLTVQTIDVDEIAPEDVPDIVFSVPTYTLNGAVVSLGNPSIDFVERLRALLNNGRSHQESQP